jgi:hypothetical protein
VQHDLVDVGAVGHPLRFSQGRLGERDQRDPSRPSRQERRSRGNVFRGLARRSRGNVLAGPVGHLALDASDDRGAFLGSEPAADHDGAAVVGVPGQVQPLTRFLGRGPVAPDDAFQLRRGGAQRDLDEFRLVLSPHGTESSAAAHQ